MLENPAALISIAISVTTGIGFIWAIKASVSVLESRLTAQDRIIAGVEAELKKLNQVVTDLAVQNQRIGTIEERQERLEKRYEELRHGEGFVLPIAERLRRG